METRLRFKNSDGSKVIFDCYIRKGSYHCGDIKTIKNGKSVNIDDISIDSQDCKDLLSCDGCDIETGIKMFEIENTIFKFDQFVQFNSLLFTDLTSEIDALNTKLEKEIKDFRYTLNKWANHKKVTVGKWDTLVYYISSDTVALFKKIANLSQSELYKRSKPPRNYSYCLSPVGNIISSINNVCYQRQRLAIEEHTNIANLLDLLSEKEKLKSKLDDLLKTSTYYSIEDLAKGLSLSTNTAKSYFFLNKNGRDEKLKGVVKYLGEDRKIKLDLLIQKYKIATIK